MFERVGIWIKRMVKKCRVGIIVEMFYESNGKYAMVVGCRQCQLGKFGLNKNTELTRCAKNKNKTDVYRKGTEIYDAISFYNYIQSVLKCYLSILCWICF